MCRSNILGDHIVIPSTLLLIIYVTFTYAGASSTPKNLVNLYTNNPSDNVDGSNLNQFQNEYQYRQSASKPSTSDRYKSSTPSASDPVFDQLTSDLSPLDYSYQDNRAATNVPECRGRLKLNGTRGFITDGPGYYQTNLQCIWLIDGGRENATIRIQFHQFNTECNYDYLYIFDGDSIYSPLVAALSGDMKDFSQAFNALKFEAPTSNQINQQNSINVSAPFTNSPMIPTSPPESRPFELKTSSGKAFIYFHSDTAQTMTGFYMTYTVDSCSLDCSNRGECDYTTLSCKCNPGYYGEGCQYLSCPNNCTSPDNGACNMGKSCICNAGYHGLDCSLRFDSKTWTDPMNSDSNVPARAIHQAVVVDDFMWIIGGKVQSLSNTNMGIFRREKTPIVSSFNLETQRWSDVVLEGTTGVDHLADVSGHSAVAKGTKIFIYGGMAMNNTVLDSLTVLDTVTNTLVSLSFGKKGKSSEEEFGAPLAVVGHTANIIDSHMYVFLGYNPLYGYINFVQKFNLADNTWSFANKRGSSVSGCIGHSTTFDPSSGLVFLYGGHHEHRSNSLYSFDPQTEVWTLLQSGPSPRYYHSAVIIDRQLVILAGNSYNTSHQSDQCFQQTYLTYDITCSEQADQQAANNLTSNSFNCGKRCWQSIEDSQPGILKRHGHSIIRYHDKLVLFGGFNGVLMNDVRYFNISTCDMWNQESECVRPKISSNCFWNAFENKCQQQSYRSSNYTLNFDSELSNHQCTKSDIKSLQQTCERRATCADCLNTRLGCVWCGLMSMCHYRKCDLSSRKLIADPNLCLKEELATRFGPNYDSSHQLTKDSTIGQDYDNQMDCKRLENCYLCLSTPHCSWQGDRCYYLSPSYVSSPSSSLTPVPQEDFNEVYNNEATVAKSQLLPNSTRFLQRLDPINRSFLAAFTTSLLNSSPHHSCDIPCYLRRSCNECTTTKCIWCSTTEQCIDSSAYFAYHAMGQCMHYVAHMIKCPVASCDDIETCDKCLTNPKCGWLNDISNTGKGRCLEGTSAGPSFTSNALRIDVSNSTSGQSMLPSWYYTNCPLCQCNGHSYCKPNSSVCVQSCQDNTDGPHCEKCVSGYFGDPINGGICIPCRCNGHAQSCNRETGKCYCSTKGIIGHNCNRCDDQNHYIGDPSSPINGTCYYNLTTDYQYTFNMSKPEDHFYSDINFINVPLRKDSDVDFTIACSRLALVNITSGTSYKNRKPIHTSLECGSFRLRFPHDRHILTETNYSFFVHVYKFQTPFILQIAFSQHRTLYLPQFFFTFST